MLEAIDDGTLEARRLDSWRHLQREMLHMAMRQDARLRAVEINKWRQISKANRARDSHRGRPW